MNENQPPWTQNETEPRKNQRGPEEIGPQVTDTAKDATTTTQ